MDRRTFLAATATTGVLMQSAELAGGSASRRLGLTELDKQNVPTPALLLDLDAFEANLKTMADHCRAAGCGFRPHAKTHKCPEIARRQIAAGALGICVATVTEAVAMVQAGIRGVLLTSPVVDRLAVTRMVELAPQDPEIMLAVGHAREVELLADAARQVTINVLIDVDVGDRRTGVPAGPAAVELARQIARHKGLKLRGLQAYAGHASHVVGFEAREQSSRAAIAKALETRDLLLKAGFDAPVLSGGSTGTYNIDSAIAGVTELQVGSYVFMDVDYRRIGGKGGKTVYTDFRPSLTVLATVVSASHPDRVTIDAGSKAIDTTTTYKPEAKGWEGLDYGRGGDEFGILTASGRGSLPRIGDRLEFIVPHCDPTTNLYNLLYVIRGNDVVDIWPIASSRAPEGWARPPARS
jgi:3-hydroxy-D-aspartate aldolase